MAEPVALHVVVRHFDYQLGTQRHKGEVLAPAPPALGAGHPEPCGPLALPGPFAPRVLAEFHLVRLKLGHQGLSLGHGERCHHPHMLESTGVVIKTQQHGPHNFRGLVPAEASHHAVRGALVLGLEHHALVG